MYPLAPSHIRQYCEATYGNSCFEELGRKFNNDNSFVYQIKCRCMCGNFNVYIDEHPTAIIKCCSCDNEIIVYELSYYPAAIKLQGSCELSKITSGVFDSFEICVKYEYPDDYENADDISWCTVWIYNEAEKRLITVIDDETS